MKPKRVKTVGEVFVEGTPIDDALNQAAQDAVQKHREAGQPLAIWKNGKTAWVRPEEVEIQGDGNRVAVRPSRRRKPAAEAKKKPGKR